MGSFNYDMSKMVFANEFVPRKEEAIKSILDYDIEIYDLRPDQTHYMAIGMNYSVAGFEMVLTRKISFYVVTYYLPSRPLRHRLLDLVPRQPRDGHIRARARIEPVDTVPSLGMNGRKPDGNSNVVNCR